MSVAYSTIRPGLVSLFSTISGVDLDSTVWEDKGQKWGSVKCKLKIKSPVVLGVDESRYEDDDTGGIKVTHVGNRQFTLSASFETISQGDDDFALTYASRAQARLKRQSSLDYLKGLGLSIANVFNLIEVPFTDDHFWSKWVLDVTFNTVSNDLDDSYDSNAWIERVEISSDILSLPIEVSATGSGFDSGFDSGFL